MKKAINLKLTSSLTGKSRPSRQGKEARSKENEQVAQETTVTQVEEDHPPMPQVKLHNPTGRKPLHNGAELRWDHKVNLIGEKIVDPFIHCCDECKLPILSYGRLIPCKHVFCYACAKQKGDKSCPRCGDAVSRVEQTGLGTVFVCTHGAPKHSASGCRRTYLSQRDLTAHIEHRHSGGKRSNAAESHARSTSDTNTRSNDAQITSSTVHVAHTTAVVPQQQPQQGVYNQISPVPTGQQASLSQPTAPGPGGFHGYRAPVSMGQVSYNQGQGGYIAPMQNFPTPCQGQSFAPAPNAGMQTQYRAPLNQTAAHQGAWQGGQPPARPQNMVQNPPYYQ